jgi:hypothetical protein
MFNMSSMQLQHYATAGEIGFSTEKLLVYGLAQKQQIPIP